jgi:hypothetical protein
MSHDVRVSTQVDRSADEPTLGALVHAEMKDSATTDAGRPRPALLAAAGIALAGVAALVWWRSRS